LYFRIVRIGPFALDAGRTIQEAKGFMTLYMLQRNGSFAKRDGRWTRNREAGAHFERIFLARRFCLEHDIQGAELVLIVAAGEPVWIPMPGLNRSAAAFGGKPAKQTTPSCNRT
jgi:hypothetical protein